MPTKAGRCIQMHGNIQVFRNYFKSKAKHPLFAIFTGFAGVAIGMLIQPWIGAFCLSIAFYLALVIFVPWHKIYNRFGNKMSLLLPTIICLVVIPLCWNYMIMLFSENKPIPNNPTYTVITKPIPTADQSNQVDIQLTYTPKPGYESFIQPYFVIENSPDSPSFVNVTYMIKLTGGFKFAKLNDIPDGFYIHPEFEHSDTIVITVKECPSTWKSDVLLIPVYNMDESTKKGSEINNFELITTNVEFVD